MLCQPKEIGKRILLRKATELRDVQLESVFQEISRHPLRGMEDS